MIKDLCNQSQMLIVRGFDNGCFVNVEPTQNIIYQGLINIYYPDVNTIIFAVAFIGLIILIKKLKKELLDNNSSNGNKGSKK